MGNALTATGLAATVLSDPHERFCQELMSNGGNLSDAYRAVYPAAGTKASVWANAARLRARNDVRDRMAALQAAAAERSLVKPTQLLIELAEMCAADPAEITRVVVEHCRGCWPEMALAAALDAAAAGVPMPDTDAPQADCAHCRGAGVSRVVITPTDELRGPARRLFQSARQKADGSIEVTVLDQGALRKELHSLLGMRVDRSVSLNLTADLKALPSNVSVEDALRMLETIAPAPADEASIVSDQ
jgi:hypothetical protein